MVMHDSTRQFCGRTRREFLWEAGGGFTASPAVVDGRIVIGNTDGTLYCFGKISPTEKEIATGDTESKDD